MKFCSDAGFLTTVEARQYFMTKDTEEFSQLTVACRKYTLPRDEELSEPKGWIRGNTQLGPYWTSQPAAYKVKNGAEIKIQSLNKDHSHSWVRISHGSNKFVMILNNNEQETSWMKFEEFALKTNVLAFASRSNVKAKPRRRTPASSCKRTVPIGERKWTDIESENYSSIAYPVSKRLTTLLRQGQLPREEDGAIEFWRIKENLQNPFPQSIHWSDDRWKACMAARGGAKKRFQYCNDDSRAIVYFRALQGHSGRHLIDPSLQDYVLILTVSSSTLVMSDVQSIYIPSSIQDYYQEVRIWAKDRQCSFCLWILRTQKHKDPETADLKAPRLARYLQTA